MANRFLSYADIALPTFEDDQALFGDKDVHATMERYSRAGLQEVVIKLGAKGCLLVQNRSHFAVPVPKPITPVDTTAAGDAFNAGYLGRRLMGASPLESATAGHVLAGAVIQHRGAIISNAAMNNAIADFSPLSAS